MQNEELKRVQLELEDSTDNCQNNTCRELYDLFFIGCFTRSHRERPMGLHQR